MSNREARLSAGDEATLRVARHPWANDLCQPRLETRNGAYRCSAQAGRSTAIALWSALEQQFDGGARQLHATTRTEAFGLANPVVSFWHSAAAELAIADVRFLVQSRPFGDPRGRRLVACKLVCVSWTRA